MEEATSNQTSKVFFITEPLKTTTPIHTQTKTNKTHESNIIIYPYCKGHKALS